MEYGYVKLTSDDSSDTQLKDMYSLGLDDKCIFVDKVEKNNSDDACYKTLKSKLKKDDLLIIKSLNKLGTSYATIIREWNEITGKIKAHVKVLDTPLLDSRRNDVSELLLQILSFVVDTEKESIRARQAEGIKLARERGVHMGRPKYMLPKNFLEVATMYIEHKINCETAIKKLNMSKGTFLKYATLLKKHKIPAEQLSGVHH